jgi:hypothetical protein
MKKFFVTAFFLTLAGCYSINQDATFVVTGQVKDANGAVHVVTASDNIQLCLDVNFAVSKEGSSGDAQVASECNTIVTDQAGTFTFRKVITLKAMSADALEIKNAKIIEMKIVLPE